MERRACGSRSGDRLPGPGRVRADASTARPLVWAEARPSAGRLRPSSRSSLRLDTDCAPKIPAEALGVPVRILGNRSSAMAAEGARNPMKRSNHAVLALAVFGLLAGSREAPGQRSVYDRVGGSSKVRVPDDLGREPLEVAKTALGGGDIDRALSIYQDILDRLPDRVAPVRLAPRTGKETDHVLPGDTFAGLRDYVADLIRAIPDGFARYREREGPRAAADLARALAARDEGLLRKIVIRWELTESGPLALAALSDLLFQSGRVAESRLCADRLLALVAEQSVPEALKTRATLRAAVAYTALQRRDDVRSLASTVASGDASVAVDWRGAPMPLERDPRAASGGSRQGSRAAEARQDSRVFRPAVVAEPAVRAQRARRRDVPVPRHLGAGASVELLPGDPGPLRQRGLLLRRHPRRRTEPPDGPAAVGSRSSRPSRRCRARGTGTSCTRSCSIAASSTPASRTIPTSRATTSTGSRDSSRVRRSRSASSTPSTRTPARSSGRTRASRESAIRRPASSSIAISVNTPPLVIGDRLYVGATYYLGGFRQWLCAFDRETGDLVWKTYIGQGQAELNMFGNPVKEVVPGYVGESNGLLVYSTNIGVVAAVDAITGAPRWVKAYEQEPVPSSDGQRTVSRPPGWTVTRPLFYAAPRDHRAERRLRRLRVQSRHRRLPADRRRPAQPGEPVPPRRRDPRRRADRRGPEGSRVRPQGAGERAGSTAQVGGPAGRGPDRRRQHRRTTRSGGRPPLLHRPGPTRRAPAPALRRTSPASTPGRAASSTRSRSRAFPSAETSSSRPTPSSCRATSSLRSSTRKTSRAGSKPRSRRTPTTQRSGCAPAGSRSRPRSSIAPSPSSSAR